MDDEIAYIWEMETCIGENGIRLLEHLHGYCHAIKSGREGYIINKKENISKYCGILIECCEEPRKKKMN